MLEESPSASIHEALVVTSRGHLRHRDPNSNSTKAISVWDVHVCCRHVLTAPVGGCVDAHLSSVNL